MDCCLITQESRHFSGGSVKEIFNLCGDACVRTTGKEGGSMTKIRSIRKQAMLLAGVVFSLIGIKIAFSSETWWAILPLSVGGAALGHYFQGAYRRWALKRIIQDLEEQEEAERRE